MSIKIKFYIILFAMAIGASFTMYEKWERYEEISRTFPLYNLAVDISHIIFELQKERGLSLGYIGSSGKEFSKELSLQKEVTDNIVLKFSQDSRKVYSNISDKTVLANIKKLNFAIENLKDMREIVNTKSRSSIDKVFLFYSNTIAKSLEIIELIAILTNDVQIAKLVNAYSLLLQIQESAGKERGAINAVLTSLKIDAKLQQEINGFIYSQKKMSKEFLNIAPEKYRELFIAHEQKDLMLELNWFRDSIVKKGVRNELLNDIQAYIGYGGILHFFERYLLRGDESDEAKVLELVVKTKHLIEGFRALSGLSIKEYQYLNIIEETVDEYKKNIEKIHSMKQKGITIEEIDRSVKINDVPAIDAVYHLSHDIIELDSRRWFTIATMNIEHLYEISHEILNEIVVLANHLNIQKIQKTGFHFSLYLIAMLFLILIIFILFKRVVGEVLRTSDEIEEMHERKEYKKISNVYGNDEVTKLQLAYNELIEERSKIEEELRQQAMSDPLTKLANRNRFNQRFDEVLKLAHREEHSFALLLLDLDKFKPINDTYGHQVGDIVLKNVAKIFKKNCRETDVIARLGGDEFAIIMVNPKDNKNDSKELAQRIIQHIEQPMSVLDNTVKIGVSIGIALYTQDARDQKTLMEKADLALYTSKDNGRNTFTFAQ